MRKSILRFGALALMSMMSISAFAFHAIDKKGEYTLNNDGTNTVTLVKANSGNTDAGKVVYDKVNDSDGKVYTVTAIAASAFKNATGGAVTEVTSVASTVKTVADNAFEGVTKICINLSQLKSIGKSAFKNVKFYTDAEFALEISNQVEIKASTIDKGAFEGTNLVSVKWGVEAPLIIPESCFASCTKLTTFQFGKVSEGTDYVTEIGKCAFYGCGVLANFGWLNAIDASYCLPKTLTTIDTEAFRGCASLTNLKFSSLVTPSILTVKDHAFQGCTTLTDVDFRIFSSATSFESGAFMGCTGLSEITIPNGITSFTDVDTDPSDNELYDGVFANCYSNNETPADPDDDKGLTKVTFPVNFTTLGINSFKGCELLLTLVNFKENANIKDIADGAFVNCKKLPGDLPKSLETIGKNAFEGTTFTSIEFPATMTEIDRDAFKSNIAITSITIVGQHADGSAFKPADKVECKSYPQYAGTVWTGDLGDYVFDLSVYNTAKLKVPYGCYDIYTNPSKQNNPTWNNFIEVETVKAGYFAKDGIGADNPAANEKFWVGGLCYEVTKNDGKGLAEVKVVDGLYVNGTANPASSGTEAAKTKANETNRNYRAQALIDPTIGITIPQYVATNYDEKLNNNAYYKVTALEAVNTIDLTLEANKNVKNEIAAVKSVVVKAKSIDLPACFNAEAGFTGLESFTTDGGSIKSFSTPNTFNNNRNLATVEFTADLTFVTIPGSAFSNCKSLASFEFPSTITTIGNNAFVSSGLESVKLPGNLTSIGYQAFAQTKLTQVNIPASVQSIGGYAFKFDYDADAKKEIGVKDVYVNWEGSIPAGIDNLAFDPERHETKNDRTIYHLRNLHYPAGQSELYPTVDLFKETTHIFNTLEGIKVNGKNVYMTGSEDLYGDPSIVLEDKVDGKGVESVVIARNLDANVTYKRTIADANVWQCWYVPFDVVAGEVEGATFAMLADTKVDGENVTIELQNVPEGKTVKANTCYVVKFDEASDKEITASGLYATVENSHTVSCASTVFTFQGLYNKATAASNSDFYIVNAKGGFQFLGKNKNVYAYRFKMTPSDNPTNPYLVKFVDIDDDATAIENVKANSLNAPMFDVMGRQIVAPAKGQVYIQNGVKKLAK